MENSNLFDQLFENYLYALKKYLLNILKVMKSRNLFGKSNKNKSNKSNKYVLNPVALFVFVGVFVLVKILVWGL